LNVTFVTFLFGPGLPILFPIGLLSLICLYIVERLMVAYSYQKPPMYDSTINTTTLNLLYIAPLIYAFSAAWMYSNQQVFKDKVVANTDTSLYPPTEHFFTQFLTQLTPGTPFVIVLVVLGLLALARLIVPQ
jgi:hypothetical protein